jgi:putative transposase
LQQSSRQVKELIRKALTSQSHGDDLARERMLNGYIEKHNQLSQSLFDRGLKTPLLVISDKNKGLIVTICESFPGASWQLCKVHFMRNILAHIPQKEKNPLRLN